MTTAVIGGAGSIGGHVVHALLTQDERVVVVDDLSITFYRLSAGSLTANGVWTSETDFLLTWVDGGDLAWRELRDSYRPE